MIELEPADDGVILPVHAQPRARKNELAGIHAGRLKVAVTQAPEKGRANVAIQKLIAESLGIKNAQVRLVSGTTSTRKRFLVSGLDSDSLQKKIAAALSGGSPE